jgi:predicted enzyme related to lactoylglutathione lyase
VSLRPLEVVIDCADHDDLIRFWSQALGWEGRRINEQYAALIPPDRTTLGILLQKVPEPKVGKNRVHIDFAADDLDAEVARLIGLGATAIVHREEFGPPGWTVMSDPEGNEFCVAGRPPPPEPSEPPPR